MDTRGGRGRGLASMVCMIMGVAFLIVALWGFANGDNVMGVFTVNTLHNVVHLVSGLAALGCAFAGEAVARRFALIFGVVYGLVAVLGLLNVQAVNDLLRLNNADDFLHVLIAGVFLVGALVRSDAPTRVGPGGRTA